MALSYPHRATFDENEKVLEFEDGLKLTFEAGSFDTTFEATIDKMEGQDNDELEAASDAYVFRDFDGIDSDKLPVKPLRPPLAVVPLRVQGTVATALTLGTNPGEEHPNPVNWTPRPDIPPGLDDGGLKATVELETLETFEIFQETN